MRRLVALALVAGGLLPGAAHAQSAPAARQGFGFCTVTDTSRAQATIWASPVFPLEFRDGDAGGVQRSLELAGEFLAHVGTLGGKGNKNCAVLSSQAEAEAFREEQRAPWSKRMYFVKAGDWRDVAWTPAPWKPAAAAADGAPVTRYFLCQATQTDLPDRSALSRTVASGVFSMPVPAVDTFTAMYQQAIAYTLEFQSEVQAHGLPVQGSCMPYDTAGEAQYAYQQMFRFSKGFNMKYTEIAWKPTGQAVTAASPATASAPAQAAAPGNLHGYCTVSQFTGGGRMWVSPLFALDMPASVTAETEALSADFLAHVGTLGGQGEAACWLYPGLAEAQRGRDATHAGWTTRRFARPDDWRDVDWAPATPATPALAASSPSLPASRGVSPAAAPPPATATPATAAQGLYCVGFATRSKPELAVRTPIWEENAKSTDLAALAASTSRLIAAVARAHPGDWDDLPAAKCHENSTVIAGESFCFSARIKRFGGGSHTAGLFCNVSRAGAEERVADMKKREGQSAQILDWPGQPGGAE